MTNEQMKKIVELFDGDYYESASGKWAVVVDHYFTPEEFIKAIVSAYEVIRDQ